MKQTDYVVNVVPESLAIFKPPVDDRLLYKHSYPFSQNF